MDAGVDLQRYVQHVLNAERRLTSTTHDNISQPPQNLTRGRSDHFTDIFSQPSTFRLLLLIYSFQFRSAFQPRRRDWFFRIRFHFSVSRLRFLHPVTVNFDL